MPDLEWVKKTVDTARRPCPLRLAERCPGERSGCAFWIVEQLVSGAQHAIVEGCMFAFQYVQSHEILLENVRTQATLQQAGETVNRAMAPLSIMARARALEGS